jgi:hypothetical protein
MHAAKGATVTIKTHLPSLLGTAGGRSRDPLTQAICSPALVIVIEVNGSFLRFEE